MSTILHLSDTHFGKVNKATLEPLIGAAHELRPDLTVVSGDLTQHALSGEFRQARRFLEQLPRPLMVVPGNHDVPMFNLVERVVYPLTRYKHYITRDLEPFFCNDNVAVMGINTASGLLIDGGRVHVSQIRRIQERMREVEGENIVKIVVTHHPFDLPEEISSRKLIRRARITMEALARCGVDVFLAGHMHLGWAGNTAARHTISGYASLVIQAGTATSLRGRNEPNSFNVIKTERDTIEIDRYRWRSESHRFFQHASDAFRHTPDGWMPLKEVVPGGFAL